MRQFIRGNRTVVTFEQLRIFVAVAERGHLTEAARAIGLTPSAVSASIRALESAYGVRLFNRVGRGIELAPAGREFLGEAKAMLDRARAAELRLSELGALTRGTLAIWASQTVADTWLPPRLMRFRGLYPGIELLLTPANTRGVAEAVLDGRAELGFVEGAVDHEGLHARTVGRDVMVVVAGPDHPLADGRPVSAEEVVATVTWVLRERGSGTRSEFEAALAAAGADPSALKVALVLPSNASVLAAVRAGGAATAISRAVAQPFLASGSLAIIDFPLPARPFRALRHPDRPEGPAARALLGMVPRA
jgi:DNA-binding transcriptional LysR family regulator